MATSSRRLAYSALSALARSASSHRSGRDISVLDLAHALTGAGDVEVTGGLVEAAALLAQVVGEIPHVRFSPAFTCRGRA